MNFSIFNKKPMFKSLRHKLLLPVFSVSIILAVITVFFAHTKFQELLIKKLAVRAELVANTVNYAAEGLSRSGELQRIVSSLGAEREIDMILVVSDSDPEKIIASTKNLFLGESLTYLNNPDITTLVHSSLKTKLKQEYFDNENNHFDLVLPLIMASPREMGETLLSNGVVFVRLDSKPTQKQVFETIAEFIAVILVLLLMLTIQIYYLLKRHVLNPILEIIKEIHTHHKIKLNSLIYLPHEEYDEILLLKDTLKEALWISTKTQQILEIQKSELQKSRDQFATLIKNIPGMTFRCALDENWTMIFMNGLVEELTGYPISDFIENSVRSYASIIYPNDYNYVDEEINQSVKANRPYIIEYRIIHRTGKIVWVHERGRGVTEPSEKIGFLDGFILDITERKLLDKERDRLLQILDDSPDFIAMSDMGANLKYLNHAAKKMVGLPEDTDIFKLKIDDMHPKWGTELVRGEGISTVLEMNFWKSENALWHKDGYEIPVSQVLTLHRDINGHPHLLSTIMRDISNEKEVQKILLKTRAIAESLAQSKSEFLANMSHEIRTPMNAIIGLSQLALDKEMPDDVRDSLQKIHSSSGSLLGILNDILDFSKIEANKLTIENEPFNLVVMFRSLHNLFSAAAQKKNLDFKIISDENVPNNLIGDSLRIQQILSNLLGNAIKFTHQGEVTLSVMPITLNQNQVKLRFCISDTGIGIKKEHQAKLFDAFSQADASITRQFGGSGLGLAISQKLLYLMNSDFEIQSEENQGTTISFELLFEIATSKTDKKQTNLNNQQGNLSEKLGEIGKKIAGLNVLLAEDNLLNQEIVCGFLKLSGVNVDTAFNGFEVLSALEHNRYDVILMDVNMPEMSGIEATEKIRAQPQYANLPIIALTAGVTAEEKDKCLASGMNNFLAKPVNPEELIQVLISLGHSQGVGA